MSNLTKQIAQHVTPHALTKWTDRLALDVALSLEGSGDTLNDIATHHKVTPSDILDYSKDPVFEKRVDAYRKDIRENGLSFRMKAKAQSEELLTTSWVLIHDPNTSAAVKADLIKSTVKWAGLEPKDNERAQQGDGGGVKITINLGGTQAPLEVIDVEGRLVTSDAE